MSSKQKSHNFGLDLIRAIAIVMVLVSHFSGHLPWNLNTFFWNGVIGVELFFALSGFLVCGIILKTAQTEDVQFTDVSRFFSRRWLRTFPAYFAMLIVYAAALQQLGFLNLKHLLFLQAWGAGYNLSSFGQTWSLCVEEYSYVLLGLVGFLTLRANRNVRSFCAVSIGIVLVSCLARYLVASKNPTYAYFDTHIKTVTWLRLDAVLAGSMLATMKWVNPDLFNRLTDWRAMKFVGLTASILVSYLIFTTRCLVEPIGMAVAFPILSVCFCLLILGTYKMSPGWLVRTFFQTIAKYSYSAYLTHILAIMIVNHFVPAEDPYLRILAYTSCTVIMSGALYLGVEKTFLKIRDRYVPADPRKISPSSPTHRRSGDAQSQALV